MSDSSYRTALKCETEVLGGGRVEVAVLLSQGTKVVVFVVPEADRMRDLVPAPLRKHLELLGQSRSMTKRLEQCLNAFLGQLVATGS